MEKNMERPNGEFLGYWPPASVASNYGFFFLLS